MEKPIKKNKPGPKVIELDWEEFDRLCELQCTLEEFACFFKCSPDTIERRVKEAHGVRFADYFAIKRGSGKIALRRKQMQKALDGDTTMLIWLGKQYLKQAEKQEVAISDSTDEELLAEVKDVLKG